MKWRRTFVVGFALLGLAVPQAGAVPVVFSPLGGALVGGVPAGTQIFKADLSGLPIASILSIIITDASFGLGGATGQFSGFDLDAIKLSTTDCLDNTCADGAVGLAVFDFTGGVSFTPGAQRPLPDAKLFGTGPAGTTVDNAVATLGLFDANSTTAIPGADGFISMGDGGILSFNLTAPVSTSGLFLYIGEVGDNGEVAASSIEVRETGVPEPGSLALAALALLAAAAARRRRS